DPQKYQIIKETRSNVYGQTEMVKFGDAAQTVAWNGYNPVTHQNMATVVQQTASGSGDSTVLAFGYQYDRVGKLIGISDWRGRSSSWTSPAAVGTLPGLSAPHPSAVNSGSTGTRYSTLAAAGLNSALPAPSFGAEPVDAVTGWPVSAAPSDAVFGYDSLYQLDSEDRLYVTNTGDDILVDSEDVTVGNRVKSLDWGFDAAGSMTSWEDVPDSGDV
ncbi:MAG: hypothetical protein GY700_02970, partial [Propionibacteriaceae bacterium]|nr:hypothetical protein [Propionibacteriaceae bacterium]